MRTYLTAPRLWQLPALVASMRRHCQPFVLHVLAWDFDAREASKSIDSLGDGGGSVWYITRENFYRQHPGHRKPPGPPRLTINHMDAARWQVAADMFETYCGALTYIDGDQHFFSSPEPVFEEIGEAKIAVSPHRFPRAADGKPGATIESHRQFGLYNSGFVYLADAEIARELAHAVYMWSYSHVIPQPDGTYLFGDQGSLEIVAKRHHAHVVRHPGLNLAPWNVHRHDLRRDEDGITVDGQPLVTYHYSGLRWDPQSQSASALVNEGYGLTPRQIELLYTPYLEALAGQSRGAAPKAGT